MKYVKSFINLLKDINYIKFSNLIYIKYMDY